MNKGKLFLKARDFSCPGKHHLPSRPENRGHFWFTVTDAAGTETEGQQEILLELASEKKC